MSKSARFAIEFSTIAKPKKNVESDAQGEMFIDAARALKRDESEKHLDTEARKVVVPPTTRKNGGENGVPGATPKQGK